MKARMGVLGAAAVAMVLMGFCRPLSGSVPAGVPTDWWTTVQKNIAAEEYHVTWQEKAAWPVDMESMDGVETTSQSKIQSLKSKIGFWQAPNRAQNLRTYFTARGPRVVRRTDSTPDWMWGLEILGFGFGISDSEKPVSVATVVATTVSGNRIEFHRAKLIEWYVNGPRGLEQGFTIVDCGLPIVDLPAAEKGNPAAKQSNPSDPSDPTRLPNQSTFCLPHSAIGQSESQNRKSKIILDLAIHGNLIPSVLPDGKAIEFFSAGGVAVLRYGQLKAYDAEGRELPATMELIADAGMINKMHKMGTGGNNLPRPVNPVNPAKEPFPQSAIRNSLPAIRIVVDASNAVFPVTIDPLASSAQWTAESNQDNASFGFSLSTAGDVNGDGYSDVIIGAPYYDNGQTDEGRAFVYYGSASGLSSTAQWTAESDQDAAGFGHSVSTAGDVNGDGYSDVIIGAPYYDNGQTDEGRAYVYCGSASGLSSTAQWTAESNQDLAAFGYSVSTAGDVNGDGYSDVIVGAHRYDNGQTDEGRAYVYCGSASGLSSTAHWTAESNQDLAAFGYSVSTAGDVNGDGYSDVVVGACLYDAAQTSAGRVYVYHGSAGGLSATANWMAESNQGGAQFGYSVSTAGDVNGDGYSDVIVGAHRYDNGQTDEGRAFVYHGSPSGLSATANWTAESNQNSAYFGCSVSTAGDVNGDGYGDVLVGAGSYENGQAGEGRVFVYHGAASGLSATANWTAESDQAYAHFGAAVSTAGDVNGDGYGDVVAGARDYSNGQPSEGRAYVYHGGPSGLGAAAGWTAESGQDNALFGAAVASAGDVNGDGFCDVVVGAYNYDGGQTDEGRVFVFHGSASGLHSTASWTAESDQAYAAFGYSVAGAGDVNGDGYCDLLIGSHQYDTSQINEGAVFVWHGSASGLGANGTPANADWSAKSNQAYANFGNAVGGAGDVNGDGFCDVIVGAYNYDGGQEDEGRVFVFHGSAAGLGAAAAWTAESNQAYANFGNAVGGAGDVNGDGFSDVIVGAANYNNPQEDEGRAYVFHGSTTGLSASANWTAEANQTYAYFGRSVGGAGDVNGDGFSDVIVGASGFDNGQSDEGRVYVYHGSAAGLSASANWTTESNQTAAWFGASVAGAGDVNGDGFSDVIIGAERYDNGEEDEGRAWVFLGSATGLSATADWTAEGNQALAYFAGCAAGGGDVNGDGCGDVIVGARGFDNGQNDEGGAWVYFGGGGGGISLTPRQLRVNTDAPIAPLCNSDSAGGVRLALRGRTPFGRGKVKLECEIKPLGRPFDGMSTITTASWEDSGVSGANLIQSVTGLASTTAVLYHWRARLLYHPAALPLMQKSHWLTGGANGALESDFRLPAESPTAAGVIRFSARKEGPVVVLEWTTAQEVDTAGFLVHCNIAGARTCLTPQIITGSGSATGRTCTVRSSRFSGPLSPPEGDTPIFWLEEIKSDGRRIFHGPVVPKAAP